MDLLLLAQSAKVIDDEHNVFAATLPVWNHGVFLTRDATQSAVMPQYVVCPSVCPSVTFRYRDHIGWNSSKIISRLNSLSLVHGLTPKWAIWCNGNTPKLGWNSGGVSFWEKNLQYLQNGARYDQRYYEGLIGSRIRAFDWYKNQLPWMTLNGLNAVLRKKSFNWIPWKLIARTISPTPSLFVIQRPSTYFQGNMDKFGGD